MTCCITDFLLKVFRKSYLKITLFFQGSIHDKISKIGALDEKEASFYCYQILEGISYLHTKNIIHRDIKGLFFLYNTECTFN